MANQNVINLTYEGFNNVINTKVPVLVDFWASWCGPCKALGPVINEIANEYTNGKARICKVNVDEQPKLAGQFGIMSIPTVLIFKNGQVVEQSIGLRSKEELKQMIDKNL